MGTELSVLSEICANLGRIADALERRPKAPPVILVQLPSHNGVMNQAQGSKFLRMIQEAIEKAHETPFDVQGCPPDEIGPERS